MFVNTAIDRHVDPSQTCKGLLISQLFILLFVLEPEIRDFQTAAGKWCDCLCFWVNRQIVTRIKADVRGNGRHWEHTRTHQEDEEHSAVAAGLSGLRVSHLSGWGSSNVSRPATPPVECPCPQSERTETGVSRLVNDLSWKPPESLKSELAPALEFSTCLTLMRV